MRAAPRARAIAFRFSPHDYEAFAASFGFEETPDQHAAIHAVIQDMIVAAADGPPGLRRRRLRQDRGRAARRLRRRASAASRWRSWRRPRCWPSSTTRPSPTASASGRSRWPSCRASARQGSQARRSRAWPTARIDIVVGTHKLLSARRQVQAPGPAGHRRGAPLRRAPQGGDQGDARRGRRADAHRHADPAHAGHGARRPARPVA